MCDKIPAVPMRKSRDKSNKKKKCMCMDRYDCVPLLKTQLPVCICDMPDDYIDVQFIERLWFGEKFVLCKSLYFDKYMETLGVGPILRKMGNTLHPMIKVDYDPVTFKFTILTTSDYLASFIKFRLGEEFDELTIDGRKCKSVVTLSENKLIHVQKHPKVTTTITREFSQLCMHATFKVNDVIAYRTYKLYVEPEPLDDLDEEMGEEYGAENTDLLAE